MGVGRRVCGLAGGRVGLGLLVRRRRCGLLSRLSLGLGRLASVRLLLRGQQRGVVLSVGVDLGGMGRRALGVGLLLGRYDLSLVGGGSLRLGRMRRLRLLL